MQAKASQSVNYEPAPAGTFPARVSGLIDMGTQEKTFQGVTSHERVVTIFFELIGKTRTYTDDEGKEQTAPITVSLWQKKLSMNDKAWVRKVTDAVLNTAVLTPAEAEAVNIEEVVGKPLLITIVHNKDKTDASKVWANIDNMSPMPEGMAEVGPMLSEPLYFSFDDSKPEDFDKLSEKMQEWLKKSPEYAIFSGTAGKPSDEIDPEDIPF